MPKAIPTAKPATIVRKCPWVASLHAFGRSAWSMHACRLRRHDNDHGRRCGAAHSSASTPRGPGSLRSNEARRPLPSPSIAPRAQQVRARASSRRRPGATMRLQMGEDRRRVLAEHTPNQLEPLAAPPAIPDLRTLSCGIASPLSHRPPHPLQGKVLRQSTESTVDPGPGARMALDVRKRPGPDCSSSSNQSQAHLRLHDPPIPEPCPHRIPDIGRT